MESDKISIVDRETWLTILGPGLMIAVALYIALPVQVIRLPGMTDPIGAGAKAMILAAIAAAVAFVLGVVNASAARRLWDAEWPSGWIARQGITKLLRAHPFIVAEHRFGGELLPYTALLASWGDHPVSLGQAPEFVKGLAAKITHLIGNIVAVDTDQEPGPGGVALRRQYFHMAFDVVKAWVMARVGTSVSREAWIYAVRFRTLGDAYQSLSVAMPIALVILGASVLSRWAGPLSVSWVVKLAGATVTAMLAAILSMLLCLACQIQSLANWIQWQGEVCRIFYVTYEGEREPTMLKPREAQP